jgi:hypothetical protein
MKFQELYSDKNRITPIALNMAIGKTAKIMYI